MNPSTNRFLLVFNLCEKLAIAILIISHAHVLKNEMYLVMFGKEKAAYLLFYSFAVWYLIFVSTKPAF